MFISKAYAQATETITGVSAETAALAGEAPSAASALAWNMGLILVLVMMFYFLLIRPQQKRFNEHKLMLDALKKGDKIVTSGGLLGTISKIKAGDDEVEIDLGEIKVMALRSSIQAKAEKAAPAKPALKEDTVKKETKKAVKK